MVTRPQFESRYLEITGLDGAPLRYHYLDEGQGDPVVMVHGNPTWHFYYRNLADHLRSGFRVVVPDHIGCGYSDKPDDSRYHYTLESRVNDLERLLDHLGLTENLTLVLHDWGGMIGMAFASRHPERIKRLVVFNTSAFLLPKSKRFPFGLWLARNTGLGAFLVRRFNAFCLIAARVCCKRNPLSKEMRKAYVAPYDSWANRIAIARFVQDIPLRPGDPSYGIVHGVQAGLDRFLGVPMMICWGLKDFVFSHHFLTEWEKQFPKAEIHGFPDHGHYILEDAADEILPLVDAFLARHPLQTPVEPVGASS